MTQLEYDVRFMNEAIMAAELSDDPINFKKVGSVIVKRNMIIGTGFRKLLIIKKHPYLDICFHAEHIALMEAKEDAKGSTLYATLEPCLERLSGSFNADNVPTNCCSLIVGSGIKRVVYIKSDDGHGHGGAEFLRENGIQVDQIKI